MIQPCSSPALRTVESAGPPRIDRKIVMHPRRCQVQEACLRYPQALFAALPDSRGWVANLARVTQIEAIDATNQARDVTIPTLESANQERIAQVEAMNAATERLGKVIGTLENANRECSRQIEALHSALKARDVTRSSLEEVNQDLSTQLQSLATETTEQARQVGLIREQNTQYSVLLRALAEVSSAALRRAMVRYSLLSEVTSGKRRERYLTTVKNLRKLLAEAEG